MTAIKTPFTPEEQAAFDEYRRDPAAPQFEPSAEARAASEQWLRMRVALSTVGGSIELAMTSVAALPDSEAKAALLKAFTAAQNAIGTRTVGMTFNDDLTKFADANRARWDAEEHAFQDVQIAARLKAKA